MAVGQKIVVQKMALNKIKLGKNSRMSVSKEELNGLMQSIKQVGLLQPIGVVKNGTGYEICYGNRRFMACSKLGFSHIPVVVHERKKESDIDLKNLTENIQRRNISINEAGRYITILNKEGLSNAEIAVRLGVEKSYVPACLRAFNETPEKFRDDLDVKVTKSGRTKHTPGKISLSTATKISSARKLYSLNHKQEEQLYTLAKTTDDFKADNIRDYARAIKEGHKNVYEAVPTLKYVTFTIAMTEDEHERLEKKYVLDGPFRSVSAACRAILSGKIHERVKVKEQRTLESKKS